MLGTEPTVSIIIPTFNREKLVCKAIKSVLNQTFSDFELIVVDDASTDQTKDVVGDFNDERIQYLRHAQNAGVCAARNTGLAVAQGRYVAFLDSDDEWLPEKLEQQIHQFEMAPQQVGVVYTWLQIIDEQEEVCKLRQPSLSGQLQQDLLYSNFIGTPSTLMVKNELIRQTDGFDTRLRCCEDWDMWLQLAKLCEFSLIQVPLVQYREHDEEGRGSTNSSAIVEGYLIFLKKHHRNLLATVKQVGSFTMTQKAGYLFNIGRRLLCHGSRIHHQEALELGQQYVWSSLVANPLSLQTVFHYFSSRLGSQLYPKAVQLENTGRRALAAMLR